MVKVKCLEQSTSCDTLRMTRITSIKYISYVAHQRKHRNTSYNNLHGKFIILTIYNVFIQPK